MLAPRPLTRTSTLFALVALLGTSGCATVFRPIGSQRIETITTFAGDSYVAETVQIDSELKVVFVPAGTPSQAAGPSSVTGEKFTRGIDGEFASFEQLVMEGLRGSVRESLAASEGELPAFGMRLRIAGKTNDFDDVPARLVFETDTLLATVYVSVDDSYFDMGHTPGGAVMIGDQMVQMPDQYYAITYVYYSGALDAEVLRKLADATSIRVRAFSHGKELWERDWSVSSRQALRKCAELYFEGAVNDEGLQVRVPKQ